MKWTAIFYWLIGIVIAVIAVAVAFCFDDAVRDFLLQHQTKALHKLMLNMSRIGDWPTHLAAGLLLAGVAWKRGQRKWTRIFLAMIAAMAIAGLTGHIIKRTLPRARPSVQSELRWGGPRFNTKYHAFPSGHVIASTAFFGVLIFARRRVGLALMPIPILIGISRMYVGAHYLSDVVCAAILGMLCAFLVARFVFHKSAIEQEHDHETSTAGPGM